MSDAMNDLGGEIVTAAIKVHTALGPGLLESAYQACLAYEIRKRGIPVETELMLPVSYGEIKLDTGYRLDMLIGGSVIVENKTVEKLLPIHEAQLLTYLKMRGCKLGYLLNWNVHLMKDGIRRIANGL